MRRLFLFVILLALIGCGPDVLYEDTLDIEADNYAICQFSLFEGKAVQVDIEVMDDKNIDCHLTSDEGINQFKDFFIIDTLVNKDVSIDSNNHFLSIQNADSNRIQVFRLEADHNLDVFVLDQQNYNLYTAGQPFNGYGFLDSLKFYFEMYFPYASEVYYVLDNTDLETPACHAVHGNLFIGQRRSSSFLVFEGCSGIKVTKKSYTFTAPKSIPYYIILVNWQSYENGGPVSVHVRVTRD